MINLFKKAVLVMFTPLLLAESFYEGCWLYRNGWRGGVIDARQTWNMVKGHLKTKW